MIKDADKKHTGPGKKYNLETWHKLSPEEQKVIMDQVYEERKKEQNKKNSVM